MLFRCPECDLEVRQDRLPRDVDGVICPRCLYHNAKVVDMTLVHPAPAKDKDNESKKK